MKRALKITLYIAASITGVMVITGFIKFNISQDDIYIKRAGDAVVRVVDIQRPPTSPDAIEAPTEKYTGLIDGSDWVFAHKGYTSYALTRDGITVTGELNTERGYGDDPDATVYVLNWKQPASEQIRFVSLTGHPRRIRSLDENGNLAQSELSLEFPTADE